MLLLYAAVFIFVLLIAAGAGTLISGSRLSLALRSVLGIAALGHLLFFLALVGWLRVIPIVIALVVAIVGGALRGFVPKVSIAFACLSATLFPLALYPPLAFDETLYHLPFVRALANSGQLRFLVDLRFPVFPQFHELLCVPLYMFAGDTATHLVSLVEVVLTAALLFEWERGKPLGSLCTSGRTLPRGGQAPSPVPSSERERTGEAPVLHRDDRLSGGSLAAAIFLGSPLVVYLATISYVDAALALFVTAGFYCLDREQFALSGFFLGTACSVKYLGGYFAVAALVLVIVRHRNALTFALSCLAAALPTTLWLIFTTGNPIFPFLGSSPWSIHLGPMSLVRTQPPLSPFLLIVIPLAIIAAMRDVRARQIVLVCAGFLFVFVFLPGDARYLVPLLPLLSVIAAGQWSRHVALLSLIAVAPGALYIVYRLTVLGMPMPERETFLTNHVPEYAALQRAGTSRIYVCGGEQLKYYARGELRGDFFGPYSYARILADDTATIAKRLQSIDANYFLVAKRACTPPRVDGGMDLVYEDRAAQLWRVQSNPSRR